MYRLINPKHQHYFNTYLLQPDQETDDMSLRRFREHEFCIFSIVLLHGHVSWCNVSLSRSLFLPPLSVCLSYPHCCLGCCLGDGTGMQQRLVEKMLNSTFPRLATPQYLPSSLLLLHSATSIRLQQNSSNHLLGKLHHVFRLPLFTNFQLCARADESSQSGNTHAQMEIVMRRRRRRWC